MNVAIPESTHFQHMLVDLIAREMHLDPVAIDVDKPFTHYGLDSIAALSIAGDLEDTLSVQLESTLLWDCPTVNALAAHLHGKLAPVQRAARA